MATPSRLLRLNRRMLGKLVLVAVLMFGFGYALVPVYQQLCEALGINVITQRDGLVEAPTNSQVDRSRQVVVELDGNSQGPWRFRPTQSSVTVHPGELTTVTYEVVNTQARAIKAQAIPSYAPQAASAFVMKVDCFCFQEQVLQANEARQMPVVFYIDPKLPREVKDITLSYTFFEIGGALQAMQIPANGDGQG